MITMKVNPTPSIPERIRQWVRFQISISNYFYRGDVLSTEDEVVDELIDAFSEGITTEFQSEACNSIFAKEKIQELEEELANMGIEIALLEGELSDIT